MPQQQHGIDKKTDKDLIVYLKGKYYYLEVGKLKEVATVVDPDNHVEGAAAENMRKGGALIAHMDKTEGGGHAGYWTTLVNLDAIIAGVHATESNEE